MTALERFDLLQRELRFELTQRILPYWMKYAVDERRGGFIGSISASNERVEDAPKGAILNARILWTFAAAYRALGDPTLRATADRAADYFASHFIDRVYGGVPWMLSADGAVLDERKHVYAQAFAIYSLTEHVRATRSESSLRYAVDVFQLLERHAHDEVNGGYREAFRRDWRLLDDVRLSEHDADECRSMNTHLHVLEAYANLFRVWPDPLVGDRLRSLIELFLDRIIDPGTGHLHAFFDDVWLPRSTLVSYGHDIEASWLLLEAADVLDDDVLRARVRDASLALARAVLSEATDPCGGVCYEARSGDDIVTDREWWVQAEAIVGFINAYEETGSVRFLDAAWQTWMYVRRYVCDTRHGEWHRRVARDGTVCPGHEKVGPWKGPYHNGRACLEVMARADRINAAAAMSYGSAGG